MAAEMTTRSLRSRWPRLVTSGSRLRVLTILVVFGTVIAGHATQQRDTQPSQAEVYAMTRTGSGPGSVRMPLTALATGSGDNVVIHRLDPAAKVPLISTFRAATIRGSDISVQDVRMWILGNGKAEKPRELRVRVTRDKVLGAPYVVELLPAGQSVLETYLRLAAIRAPADPVEIGLATTRSLATPVYTARLR